MRSSVGGADDSAISAVAAADGPRVSPASPMGPSSRLFRAAGRRGVKNLAHVILPQSVVAWKGRAARTTAQGNHRRPVALTFDDGPSDLTVACLKVLACFGARATFFVSGALRA